MALDRVVGFVMALPAPLRLASIWLLELGAARPAFRWLCGPIAQNIRDYRTYRCLSF